MRVLRSVVGGQEFLATDRLDIINIGIEQLALFVLGKADLHKG